ncbi:MAG TPA: type VI secretion system baseplate subunit TssE [Polyangiaceae bacterium]|nr:type VI secretion system baseplate subunit TssE [Polyangiaceae bacterium]
MSKGHSLLTRIRKPQYAVARRSISDVETRDSVLAHLRVICETRAGTMLSCPDYGTATVSEMVHAFPDAIAEMAQAIRTTIQKHEPRLTNVKITHVPAADLTLRYEISAYLVGDGAKVPVQFETSLDESRRLTVR